MKKPPLITRLRAALARFLLGPAAQYEAGQRTSARRSYVQGYVQDARFDADAMTRLEILRKARYFERNSALVNRLADLFEEYTAGPRGLAFVPASSNEVWNARATAWWDAWGRYPDLRSLQSWGTLQSLVARSWAIDGEIFIQKTYGRERPGQPSYPRVQLIEAHRIETPPVQYGEPNIVDGIDVDGRGRPVRYWVREGNGFDEVSHVPVEASDMVHVFEPSRPGMYRGLSMLYPVLNDLHDLDDLQMLTMDKAKERAATVSVVTTKTGELPADAYRAARFNIPDTEGTSGGSAENRTQYYEDVFRGRVKVMKEGDKYEEHATETPSIAEREHWDYLVSKVCAGFGVSKLLVFPHSMQGTVTRADLDTSATFFRSRSGVLTSHLGEIYQFVMEAGVRTDRGLADPPADWRAVTVRAPRSVNVDVGRNSNALIAEYEAGWRSLEEICGELGMDWRQVLRQRAKERALARAIEDEYGLEPGSLIKAALDAIQKSAARQQPQLEEAT